MPIPAPGPGYTDPLIGDLIRAHHATYEIMQRRDKGDEAILDCKNMDKLRDFLDAPELERKADVTETLAAIKKGSYMLVDYIAVSWSSDTPALSENEENELRMRFVSGLAN
ncbi:hypothetical protein Sste5346_008301 [Sporothrix stenoceras]|uniref:Uncharacterized protein n=1 Tax=Sporothrix stenoceras TaxID=5173 RepID=A0ABR3YSH2_9PEZI